MNLFLLPGNSASNKKWIEDVQKKLTDLFENQEILYYDHWQNLRPVIDIKKESEKLEEMTSGAKNYAVFAKSAGCLLALKAISEKKIKPKKCIFLGLPVSWGKLYGFDVDKWINNMRIKTLFIQKTTDPAMHFLKLQNYLNSSNIKNYQLKEIAGNTHDYLELDVIKDLVKNFI